MTATIVAKTPSASRCLITIAAVTLFLSALGLTSCSPAESEDAAIIKSLSSRISDLEKHAAPLRAELNCENHYFEVVAVRKSGYAFEVQCLGIDNSSNPPQLLLKVLNPYAIYVLGLQAAVVLRGASPASADVRTRFELPLLDPGVTTGFRVQLEPGQTPDPSRCIFMFTTWGAIPSPDSLDLDIATPTDGPQRVFRVVP